MNRLPESILSQVAAEELAVQTRIAESEAIERPHPTGTIVDESLQVSLGESIHEVYGTPIEAVPELPLSDPPAHIGEAFDVAAGMFPLARVVRKSPADISGEVADKIQSAPRPYLAAVRATGPYVNMQLDRPTLYDQVIREAVSQGDAYGHSDSLAGSTVFIDYSSPNIAKRLGLQHAPTTFVGEALARINEAAGANVVRANHLGDFGTPFGKVLVGLERYGDPERLARDPVGHMHELYVRINDEAKDDDNLNEAARAAFAELERGDPRRLAQWEQLRAANILENEQLYARLGIHFDTTVGESFFADPAQDIVEELLDRGIAEENDGVVLVPAERTGSIPLVLRKSDGATLYGTRDLAALRYRTQTYHPDRIKYVVGAEQAGQLAGVFAVAEQAGLIAPGQAQHVKLGLLANPGGKKMSSRMGMTATFEGVLDDAVATAAQSLVERYADQPERAADIPRLAEALGIGAVAYTILRKDPGADTELSADAGAARDAGTAGYLQYTHARAGSVVRKSEMSDDELLSGPLSFAAPQEWAVARAVMEYPVEVARAARSDGPHHVARSLETLAGEFSRLYQSDVSILGAPTQELRRSRVAAARAVQIVLRNGLELLTVEAPDQI